jgi:tetratricopeptide (TPR) repeat protein
VIPRAVLLVPAVLALAGCGRSAGPPRTVPDASQVEPEYRDRYLRALERAALGDAVGAGKALAPLLRVRPLHVPSHLLHQDLARTEKGKGSVDGEYAAIAKELPTSADAAVLLARVRPGTREARIEAYQAAAVRDPAAPWPRIALATARTEQARELLAAAAARERDGFAEEAARQRAAAKSALERARTEAERAVALSADLAPAHGALGHALAAAAELVPESDRTRRDLLRRALDSFGRALALDPGDPGLLLGRGLLLVASDRKAAAVDLDAAAAAAPRDRAALAARARNLSEAGLLAEALEAWRAAVAALPGDPDLRVDLGRALGASDRWRQALAEFRRADALYESGGGERWKARRGLVTALVQLGIDEKDDRRLDEAREQLAAYRAEGGPDGGWAAKEAEFLGEAPPQPVK